MCGIAGLLNLTGAPMEGDTVLKSMASCLVHRGPDDEGFLVDGPAGFGFRRLSIIDLEAGHQPVPNEQRTIWVMFNGEVYNFVELREQLQKLGHTFETRSDTECIVHAYESYGLDFVQHLRGMFAIALWDSTKQRLVLARDRIGKKPLFYSVRGGQLAFASEIKSLLSWPNLKRSINPTALHDYLTFLAVPAPDAIFEEVHKLPPGHLLVADCGEGEAGSVQVKRYWSLPHGQDRSKPLSYYADGLRDVLTEAVRLRLRSDVPLGAFLSGGIDSSIVVGLMSRLVPEVRTFSIGFRDKRFDETSYARIAAEKFGTIHTEEIIDADNVSPEEFRRLVWHMDEPFGDSSFVPTYWVSKTARKHVTVALSGDGGDELFGGYTSYRSFQLLQRLSVLPRFARQGGKELAGLLRSVSRPAPPVFERLRKAEKALELSALPLDRQILALSAYLDEASKAGLYSKEWRERVYPYTSLEKVARSFSGNGEDPLTKFMRRDIENYMVDDILVKVDRASMACSLEARAPILDHKVVEFAMGIPTAYKMKNGKQKIVLKEAFADLLPPQIAQRGKQGFELPFAHWFQQGEWRAFLLDMLSEQRLREQGIFDPKAAITLRDNLLSNPEAVNMPVSAYQLRHHVWLLLVFQVWYDQFIG